MSNYEAYVTDNGLIKAWTKGVPFEYKAQEQAKNIAQMPFIHNHIAIMPDVHFGIGATVGSVIPTIGAIIPAAVGVDIGCGMIAQKLRLNASQLPDNLSAIRSKIEEKVPVGNAGHDMIPKWHVNVWKSRLEYRFGIMVMDHPEFEKANHINHLGSLGGGNHFIELCIDEADNVWIMLHSGSRGIGNLIGRTYIQIAKKDMKVHHINLPDQDLAYLSEGTQYFNDYVFALRWAQDFAEWNRKLMLGSIMEIIINELDLEVYVEDEDIVSCHHNYVQKENHFGKNVWLTRKGAVSAQNGQLGIIPGSMGAKSYIVRGKGNPDSFNSCSHGAGRVMSRGDAKRKFTINDHIQATAGVECKKDESVLDETPGAYKSIDAVMAAQSDLVEIVHELKQVLCIKG